MSYNNLYKNKKEYYFGGKRVDVLQYIPENLEVVLDVGCSSGDFGNLLKKKGISVWGVEPNTDAANIAKSKIDIVINALFDEKILSTIGS